MSGFDIFAARATSLVFAIMVIRSDRQALKLLVHSRFHGRTEEKNMSRPEEFGGATLGQANNTRLRSVSLTPALFVCHRRQRLPSAVGCIGGKWGGVFNTDRG